MESTLFLLNAEGAIAMRGNRPHGKKGTAAQMFAVVEKVRAELPTLASWLDHVEFMTGLSAGLFDPEEIVPLLRDLQQFYIAREDAAAEAEAEEEAALHE